MRTLAQNVSIRRSFTPGTTALFPLRSWIVEGRHQQQLAMVVLAGPPARINNVQKMVTPRPLWISAIASSENRVSARPAILQ
jgi:hypothetical protein